MKTGLAKTPRARQAAITYANVLGVLLDDESRSSVLARYKEAGFSPDDFATLKKARETMSEALIAREDVLEMSHPGRKTERSAIQAVRRQLERHEYP